MLIEIEAYGERLDIDVDAKFHERKIDVKDVEEVIALAQAVNASQVIIVAANGWTEPAEKKAKFENCGLRLFTLEDALAIFVPDMWQMCPNCKKDCIVLNLDGAVGLGFGWLWWLGGQCRECRFGFVWCQDCGENMGIRQYEEVICGCRHGWTITEKGLFLRFAKDEDDDVTPPTKLDEGPFPLFEGE